MFSLSNRWRVSCVVVVLLGLAESRATEPSPGCPEKAKEPKSWFETVPIRKMPRPGNFPVPPKGSGYYSARDVLEGNCRDNPPKVPYSAIGPMPSSFFDSDFRYLDSSKNTQHDFFDFLHPLFRTGDVFFSTGGELRWRHMNETNSRLTARTNDYDLFRGRVYGDLWYKNRVRLFAEFHYADSVGQELNPLGIDVNRSDILNAFVDVKVGEFDNDLLYVRLGRQELLLGSQRLVSTLDWANARRTFQGTRFIRYGEKIDFDLFWLQPVVPNRNRFDSVDNDQNFAGAWTTYKPQKGHFLDLYYLFLDDTSPRRLIGDPAAVAKSTHTLGGRYVGNKDNFLWDVEGMVQLGNRGNQSVYAGAATVGAGYNLEDAPLSPTVWVYYDYASGDDGGANSFNTFDQLFPFGHYYLGWVDQVGRQNIHDVNAHLFLYPAKWVTVWMQYHNFQLANARDALYNAAGVATRRDPTGRAGRDVGNEIDIILNFHLGPHSDLFLGYSKLFAGGFLDATAGGRSPELFFAQYSFRW